MRIAEIKLRYHVSSSAAAYHAVCTQRGNVVGKLLLAPSASGGKPVLTIGDVAELAGAADLAAPLKIDLYAVLSQPAPALPGRSIDALANIALVGTPRPTLVDAPSPAARETEGTARFVPRKRRRIEGQRAQRREAPPVAR